MLEGLCPPGKLKTLLLYQHEIFSCGLSLQVYHRSVIIVNDRE